MNEFFQIATAVFITLGGCIVIFCILLTEVNKQWRREFHALHEQYGRQIEKWRSIASYTDPLDPGENKGGVEGVQMGVGEFYHLQGAKIVDPLDETANLDLPFPAQERNMNNG